VLSQSLKDFAAEHWSDALQSLEFQHLYLGHLMRTKLASHCGEPSCPRVLRAELVEFRAAIDAFLETIGPA
jgi:hypothetical protein